MSIKEIGRAEFLQFKYALYNKDARFCDSSFFNMISLIEKDTAFTKSVDAKIIGVIDAFGKLSCVSLITDCCRDTLYVAYFDAEYGADKEAAELLEYAKNLAKERGKEKLVIGINGHVSYGVGILQNEISKPISFDSLYNKPYYKDYFKEFSKSNLATYEIELSKLNVKFKEDIKQTALKIKEIDLTRFDEEMREFTYLCNETLKETDFYFCVEPSHMGELISGLKPFLKSENILFVEDERGKKVGFLFWHKDYNELFNKGKKTSILKVALNSVLKGKKIKTAKINAVGVLKEYRSSVAFSLLLTAMKERTRGKYNRAETTYVLDTTRASRVLLLNSGFKRLNEYAVYEWRNNAEGNS